MKESLIGQYIVVYLAGGWELSGEVSIIKDDKFFIKNKDRLFMVFVDKISAIHINAQEKSDTKKGPGVPVSSVSSGSRGRDPISMHDDRGSFLPLDMLTEDAQNEASDDDFSVFFGGAASESSEAKSGITFSLDEDNEDT